MAFEKGQSSNPGGRPVTPEKFNAIRDLARGATTEAVEALREAVKKPGERVQAATVLLAYGYGRPAQTVNVRKITSMADLTDEELEAIVANSRHEATAVRH